MKDNNVRLTALNILDKVLTEGGYSNLLINEAIKSGDVEVQDRALLTEIVYGTLQHKLTLEFYLEPFIKTNIKGWMRRLLMMSVYQAVYLTKIPDHAIINEAVEITKRRGSVAGANAVNAILRNFQRTPLREFSEIKDELKRISVETSTPLWLVKHWKTHFGLEVTKKICDNLLERPDTSIRVNTTRLTVEAAVNRLEAEGYTVKQSTIVPECLFIEGPPIVQTRLFKDGLVSIQDASSMLVAHIMDPQPGETILDTCSAPGGKTCHMAERLNNTGHIDAFDIHEHKLELIDFNLRKLRLTNVEVGLHDARAPFDRQYDKVLVDAPCSGLGVAKRKPEIKYEKSQKDIDQLWPLQLDILANAAASVKPGGLLIYSTCTIEQMENENVVYSFIKQNKDFAIEPIVLGDETHKTLQILPHDFNADGFFIAKLRRKDVS
ncbi:16S rRNA (cytosine(967)-C(5))-methyltransferase RsmB [Macrococcus equipercicus]|uniref:16S rRNA (cytosine(967)-C(5))-methyltransferase n=1 Tax=Macrococcus equipercicus TaxID=69967 RepID=A0A9Q9BQ28_9STAP|nr:16S rRNA (cytosine(967)-C(5))-methyltransferase RsmB [Macrococcus equipercicus]KAA1042744.1 16S rRNA (cytosine(967)-C(5))-methyltransferase RsmB [Macrococcus equipercicus]UTH14610.1 16S rRNA (cytosine(967)-C(5))-methyltransferase RsmB [Macrococcus equipercicus]